MSTWKPKEIFYPIISNYLPGNNFIRNLNYSSSSIIDNSYSSLSTSSAISQSIRCSRQLHDSSLAPRVNLYENWIGYLLIVVVKDEVVNLLRQEIADELVLEIDIADEEEREITLSPPIDFIISILHQTSLTPLVDNQQSFALVIQWFASNDL